ncbi:hypothetical protein B296_00029885 [Ensete ventricosum]|uniref:WRC domain-containing protein n=1 Tax=Ensete ventricosum TaxID=4639 RepID=A0A426XUP4_ENSVE|nr:hypothetical protein B296_00029885 [Ensete ventricosum]
MERIGAVDSHGTERNFYSSEASMNRLDGKAEGKARKKVTAKMKRKKKDKAIKTSGGTAAVSASCKKSDGKGWHCKRPAQHPQSLCRYHLSQLRSYSCTHSNGKVAGSVKEGPIGVAGRKKKTDIAGADSNFYYYYSGFGPWRGKMRGGSSDNGDQYDHHASDEDDGNEYSESGNGCDAAVAGDDQDSDDEDCFNDGGSEGNKSSCWKRGRRKMKARRYKLIVSIRLSSSSSQVNNNYAYIVSASPPQSKPGQECCRKRAACVGCVFFLRATTVFVEEMLGSTCWVSFFQAPSSHVTCEIVRQDVPQAIACDDQALVCSCHLHYTDLWFRYHSRFQVLVPCEDNGPQKPIIIARNATGLTLWSSESGTARPPRLSTARESPQLATTSRPPPTIATAAVEPTISDSVPDRSHPHGGGPVVPHAQAISTSSSIRAKLRPTAVFIRATASLSVSVSARPSSSASSTCICSLHRAATCVGRLRFHQTANDHPNRRLQ